MVIFKDSDLVFFPSGTSGNKLGGAVYTTDGQLGETIHSLFNIVSSTERSLGKTKYRCIYMKNTSTLPCLSPKIFVPQNTASSGTELFYAFDKIHGVGDGTASGVASTIPDESTAPTGILFKNGTQQTTGDALGADIPPNKMVAIWLQLRISAGTEKEPLDGTELWVQTANEKDVEETVTVPTDTNTGVTGETESNDWFAQLLERLRLRPIDWFVVCGNTTSNTNPTSWLNMLGFIREKTALAFGLLDSINPNMKTQLTTTLSNNLPAISNGYYSKSQHNLYEIFMDVTKPFEAGSAQYDFINANLDSAKNNPNIDFIVVYCNKAFYATLAANDTSQTIDGRLRSTYHKLFEDKGVHVVITGQFRNYQRQKVLSWNGAAPDNPGQYTTGEPNYVISTGQKSFGSGVGCLFIGIGTGGRRPLHTFSAPKSYTSFTHSLSNNESVGYMMLKSEPRRPNKSPKLTGSYYEYYQPNLIQSIFGAQKQEVLRDQWSITIT